MSPLLIYQDDYDDATVVSNLFIDEYMKDANDAQLKVFLYLIRMMSAHKVTSISDIADKFNYTEKDIIRALKYWEKIKLLSVEYDDARNPVGIHFKSISRRQEHELLPPASCAVPREIVFPALPEPAIPDPAMSAAPASPAESLPGKRSNETQTLTAVPAALPDKPTYSLDELQTFKEAEETSQLLFVVEQYLGKTLSSSEITTILFFSDGLHFSVDLIDHLIQYCVERGKKDFRYIETVALGWAAEGISTPKQAVRTARKYDKIVYDTMKALGKSGTPTKAEAAFVQRWSKEMLFSPDIILEACERTVLATDNHRFEYCNTILTNWQTQNVRHQADIRQLDLLHAQNKAAALPARNSAAANKFNQFKQNHYDYEALEKELLSN